MNIVAISDLHGTCPEIPPCDFLLIAGDICPTTDHSPAAQRNYLDGPFREWLWNVPAGHVVGVAGNHDFIFERCPELVPSLPWIYLQDSGCQIEGLNFYGTPWQPRFWDWAFNLDEPELEKKWADIPDDTDVLICHGAPRGHGDLTMRGVRTGSPSLTSRIVDLQPKLVVYGHIHEGRGQWTIGKSTLANVSMVDEKYQSVHKPTRFTV